MFEKLESFWLVTEYNSWEGETWYHYFLDSSDVFGALTIAVSNDKNTPLSGPIKKELSWPQVEVLANLDPGYMCLHWFGELTKSMDLANCYDLYKGKIRNYGEELLEYIEIADEVTAS